MVECIDLVGNDPDAVPAGNGQDCCQFLPACGPACRVRRRIHEDCPGLGRYQRFKLLEIQRPGAVREVQWKSNGPCPAKLGGGYDVRPGRRKIDKLVAGRGQRLRRQHDGMHPRPGDVEMVAGKRNREMPCVVARQGLPQFRYPPLPSVEGFAGEEGVTCRPVDEIRRGQVTLPRPERNEPLLAPRIGDDLDDTAFRCGKCTGAETFQDRHTIPLRLSVPHSAAGRRNPMTIGEAEIDLCDDYQRALSRSRISASSSTSAGGGAGASSTGFFSSAKRMRFTTLTIRKIIQARIRKFRMTVTKLP